MPYRTIVNRELASLFGLFGHADRLTLLEELREGERDVHSLTEALGISQSRVSQHLSLLRAHRVVHERRDGRHVIYRLADPGLVTWLLEGVRFVEHEACRARELQDAVDRSREAWGLTSPAAPSPAPAPRNEAPSMEDQRSGKTPRHATEGNEP